MNNNKSRIQKLLLVIALIFDIDVFVYSTRGIGDNQYCMIFTQSSQSKPSRCADERVLSCAFRSQSYHEDNVNLRDTCGINHLLTIMLAQHSIVEFQSALPIMNKHFLRILTHRR